MSQQYWNGVTFESEEKPSINDIGNFSGFLKPHVGSPLVLSVANFDRFLTSFLDDLYAC